jgi:hypothetical protein
MAYGYVIDVVNVTDGLDNNVQNVAVESVDGGLQHCKVYSAFRRWE